MAGKHARDLQHDRSLPAGIVRAGSIAGVVEYIDRAGVIMAAYDDQLVRMAAWNPGSHVIGGCIGTRCMHERVADDL